jgi:predicted dehydrogenase
MNSFNRVDRTFRDGVLLARSLECDANMLSSPKAGVSHSSSGSAIADPLGFGLVGLGGYAKHALRCLRESAAEPDPTIRLTAVCDPDVARFAVEMAELRASGLPVYTNLDQLLADPRVQAVWLPVPITLHRKFTHAAVEAGKAVLCEKPAAATVDEVDQMIADRDRTGQVVAIGFQDIYDPLVQDAKRRILAGELGPITKASVWGVWPRDSFYYGRNTWAGGLRRDGEWVLDSPASNAMAHFITLMLYLLGPTQETAAVPVSIEAELYRANAIDNYDTCGLRVTVEGGASVLILLTHAGRRECETDVVLTGKRGSLSFKGRESLTWTIGKVSQTHERVEPFADMIRSFARRVAGDVQSPIATLEIARQHTVVINGASEASQIHDIGADQIETIQHSGGATSRAIFGIESVLATCAALGKLPNESGICSWTRPASSMQLKVYHHFAGPRPQ